MKPFTWLREFFRGSGNRHKDAAAPRKSEINFVAAQRSRKAPTLKGLDRASDDHSCSLVRSDPDSGQHADTDPKKVSRGTTPLIAMEAEIRFEPPGAPLTAIFLAQQLYPAGFAPPINLKPQENLKC